MAESIHCIVFARAPRPGRVKTRLSQFLGPSRAASLYSETLRAALSAVSSFSSAVYCASEDESEELAQISSRVFAETGGHSPPRVEVQSGAELGERMADAFLRETAETNPDDFLCLIGSDLPQVSKRAILKAFELVNHSPDSVVLGPAEDGGYWLIGALGRTLRSVNPGSWFESIEWSGPEVLKHQCERLHSLNMGTVLAETLADVDDARAFFSQSRKSQMLSRLRPDVRVILPVLNEAENLPFVLAPLAATGIFSSVLCVDNGSTDGSAEIAESLGASVIRSERGYGNACLAGLAQIRQSGGCEVVLFLDADGSDRVDDLWEVLAPVVSGRVDFCLGRRVPLEPGALLFHARFGNWLSCFLMRLFWNGSFQDLGPMRALRFDALESLGMEDRNFGWTVEMQIRALKKRLKILEIPVGYRKRMHGKSKVSASIRGSIFAGFVILRTVFRELLRGSHGG